MPISIKVGTVGSASVAKLRKQFAGLNAKDVLRSVPTKDLLDTILTYARVFAHRSSTEMGSARRRYLNSLGAVPSFSEMSFADTWRVRRVTSGASLAFELYSVWETKGGIAGQRRLAAIEHGRKAGSYVARRTFVFKDAETDWWTTIREGRVVHIAARDGLHVTRTTANFIKADIVPQVQERIRDAVRKKLLFG